MEKLENRAFGAKVQSAKESHKNGKQKISSKPASPVKKRFGSPIMVENLAYTPSVSPLPRLKPPIRRRRWKRDDAFLVIKRDHNNNDKQEPWITKRQRGVRCS